MVLWRLVVVEEMTVGGGNGVVLGGCCVGGDCRERDTGCVRMKSL